MNIKHALKRNTYIDGTAHKPKERMVKKIKQLHIRANAHWRETARVNTDILFQWLREEQIKMPSFTDGPLVPNSFTVEMMNVYFRI